jgi:16S rRNA (uracil1498-N3)-methyltransferase
LGKEQSDAAAMADRYFVPRPLAAGPVLLDGAEARHLAVVCRVRAGDAVTLFNGDGREYPARVVAVSKRAVDLDVEGVAEPARETPFRLEAAAPLPKGDRAQFLLEKLTELGVTAFTPLRTARSGLRPGDAKMEKLQRYVIEASKQCGRNVLLHVGPLTEWEAFVSGTDLPGRKLLAHPGGGRAAAGGDVVFAVGPEGGFTDAEVERGRAAGWEVVGLGPRVLRVETAALALAVLAGGGA